MLAADQETSRRMSKKYLAAREKIQSGQVSGTQSTEKGEREAEYVAPFQTRNQSPLSYYWPAREGNAQ